MNEEIDYFLQKLYHRYYSNWLSCHAPEWDFMFFGNFAVSIFVQAASQHPGTIIAWRSALIL